MTCSPARKVLLIGYNTLDQARAKGLIWDQPQSCEVWYNPGNTFEMSYVFIPFGKRNRDLLLTTSIRYIEWEFSGSNRLFKLLAGLKQGRRAVLFLRSLIPGEGIEVIRANGPHIPAFLAYLLRRTLRIPTVVFIEAFWERLLKTQHYIPTLVRYLLPLWYKKVYRSFDIYCGTPSVDPDYFVARGMPRDKISDWTHEIDLETLFEQLGTIKADGLLQLSRPRLVAVGRLHPEKHPEDLVEVLAQVRAQYPQAQLVLVGDGEFKSAIMQRARKHGVAGEVHITGSVKQAEGLALVTQCDIYLAPMQGNALVEAMAAGMPIVAYDHAWHRNLLEQDLTGLLVPYRDITAMARAVLDLLASPDRCSRLGSKAREAAYRDHGREIVAGKLRRPFDDAVRCCADLTKV
jgi:glycosyltransferase involved in cell wall biosynthesis